MIAKLSFTENQKSVLKLSRKEGHKSWGHIRLNLIKAKIKDHHLIRQNESCCYCNRNIGGEFRMVLDIEHILPKSRFVTHMFTQRNLSISCKRCNMNIKKDDISFLAPPLAQLPNRIFRSRYYKFIHPNLDNYDSHLLMYHFQRGRTHRIIKYEIQNNSAKGKFNYEYFKLDRLERNSFDEAQGAPPRVEIKDPKISNLFSELKSNFNQ